MIRPWSERDAEESYAIYASAVLDGAGDHYDDVQRRAWVPKRSMEDWWVPRLSADITWLAEDAAGPTGLIALRPDGYLDLFFTLPRVRGDGTAGALYETLREEARKRGLCHLSAHASHLLCPFLEKRGWRVIAPEDIVRNGVVLRRFEMALDDLNYSQAS